MPSWYIGKNGYARVNVYDDGESHEFYAHKLLAASEYGVKAFNQTIHHINNHKLDNRLENLELVEHGEHTKIHLDERWSDYRGTKPWHDEDILRELYEDKQLTAEEIGERLGVSKPTILKWLRKNEIEVRPSNNVPMSER
jgi:hypothetical protein